MLRAPAIIHNKALCCMQNDEKEISCTFSEEYDSMYKARITEDPNFSFKFSVYSILELLSITYYKIQALILNYSQALSSSFGSCYKMSSARG